jgi:hypothetical protein
MQSISTEPILPQFTALLLSNAIHPVPRKRCRHYPTSEKAIPDNKPPFQSSLFQVSPPSREIGRQKRSAFGAISTAKKHRKPSIVPRKIERMQCSSQIDELGLPFDDFGSLSSPRSGFFLSVPCDDTISISDLSPKNSRWNEEDSTEVVAHSTFMHNTNVRKRLRHPGPLTRSIRIPSMFLKPRFKNNDLFL